MSRKKILYLSDLDGTLLRPDATLDPRDAEQLNALAAAGVSISYATARTIASVSHILAQIRFTENSPPIALMNGVLIRDMARQRYVQRAVCGSEIAARLFDAMRDAGTYPFVYTLTEDGALTTCYRAVPNAAMQAFMDDRIQRYGKPFRKINGTEDIDGDIIYFCLVAPEEDVRRAEAAIAGIPHIRTTSYRDSYDTGVFYLEIFDEHASKKHAAEYLRHCTGADMIVCFGDNLNDLPMFEASDIRVAAENAHPTLKAQADAMAHSGVAAFIAQHARENGLIY